MIAECQIKCRSGTGVFDDDLIADNVTIGSNVTVLSVSICEGAVIGAGSVVTKDITEKGIYAGNPAKKLRDLP